jgi:hypothetical protein
MTQKTYQGSVSNISWLYEGVFEWQAECSWHPLPLRSTPEPTTSHCLLRIYLNTTEKKALVLASELHSNEQNISLTLGYSSLARAINECFSDEFSHLTEVLWLAHYGEFSVPHSYCELGRPQEFVLVDLPWPLPEQISDTYNMQPQSEEQWRELLLEHLPLSSVAQLEAIPDILLRCVR